MARTFISRLMKYLINGEWCDPCDRLIRVFHDGIWRQVQAGTRYFLNGSWITIDCASDFKWVLDTEVSYCETEDAPPVCPDRRLVFQICNENSAKDDNFDVYLNDVLIGQLDLSEDRQIGSVFIASSDEPDIVSADFSCPLENMVAYYFPPTLVLGGTNTIKMVNTANHNNGNYGTIGVRNYLVTGNELSDPCPVANLVYSGASGANFEVSFDYTLCCADGGGESTD